MAGNYPVRVSIILPSLNAGEYIGECLQGILRQTLEDIEVLCVDAGSTDGTREAI
ncbi:MAG: glycosyltransferase, partial [Selenomonadaceae bacterium]|nr:glycosyltransferase [Selenomonadaceae bacterium]